MANYANYRLPLPEARRLASLHSIRHDLEGTIEYCGRLAQFDVDRLDYVAWEAWCAAAVVRYARCYSPTVREGLKHALLDRAPPDLKEAHQYFLDVRNKHIAHSVNEFEENDVTVTARHEADSFTLGGLGSHHGTVVGLGFGEPDRLKSLCNWVLAEVQARIKAEEALLLPIVQALGAEAVVAFGHPETGKRATKSAAKRGRSKP